MFISNVRLTTEKGESGFSLLLLAPPGSLLLVIAAARVVFSVLLAPMSSSANDDKEWGTQGLRAISGVHQGCSPLETAATAMVRAILPDAFKP